MKSEENRLKSELIKLDVMKIKKRLKIWDLIIDKMMDYEDKGIVETDEKLFEMAVKELGSKLDTLTDEYFTFKDKINPKIIKLERDLTEE